MSIIRRAKRLRQQQSGVSIMELILYIALVSAISLGGFGLMMTSWEMFSRTAQNLDQQMSVALVNQYLQPKLSTANIGTVGVIGKSDAINPVPGDTSYNNVVAASNPKMWYRFNESSGSIAFDQKNTGPPLSANSTPTAILGAPSVLPRYVSRNGYYSGKVLNSGYFRTSPGSGLNSNFNLGTNFTIETWVTLNNTSSITRGILSRGNGGYELQFTPSRQIRFLKVGGSTILTSPSSYAPGTYYIAVTRSGNNYTLYVNGVSRASSSSAQSLDVDNNLVVGASQTNSVTNSLAPSSTPAFVDELAFYETALSGAEISNHYYASQAERVDGSPGVPEIDNIIIPTSASNDQFLINNPIEGTCTRVFYVERLKQLRAAEANYQCTHAAAKESGGIWPRRGPNEEVAGGATDYRLTNTGDSRYDYILDALPDTEDGPEPAAGGEAKSVTLVSGMTLNDDGAEIYNRPQQVEAFTFLNPANQPIDFLNRAANSQLASDDTYQETEYLSRIAAIKIQGFIGGEAVFGALAKNRAKYLNTTIALKQVCSPRPVE